ncbi:YhgE/Pip family protein [Lacticaseibacillus saniviri]
MLKAEFKYLMKNKLMLVVLFVILFIPSIYAGTFLASMWDPYGQLDKLPVAVVNQDRSATMNGKTLKLGQQLSDNLTEQQALKFTAVSAKKADDGLKSGKYYAIYTIPADFSKNATTILTDSPHAMQLKLETSSGHNLMAGKMASGAATTMQTKLNGQVASTYAKVLVSAVTKLEGGMTQAADGSQQLASGSQKLRTGANTLDTNMQKLANGSLELKKGGQTLSTGIGNYVAAVSDVKTGTNQLATGLNTVNTKLPALGNGLTQLQTGSGKLAQGLQTSTNGLTQLQAGAQNLNTGLQQYQNSTATLATKSTAFAQQLDQFATQLNTAMSDSSQQAQLQQLATLIKATQTALQNVSASQTATATAVNSAIAAEAKSLNLTTEQTQALQQTTSATMTASADKQSAALAPLLTQLQQALTQLSSPTAAQGSQQLTGVLTQLTGAANQLASANTQLATAGGKLTSGSQQIANGIDSALAGNQQLTQGANTLNQGISSALPQVTTLTDGIAKLSDGANTLNQGVSTLNSKSVQLENGADTLTNGLDTAASGTSQLASGTTTLNNGVTTLNNGTTQLSTKLGSATAQLPKLNYDKKQSKAFASPVDLKQTDKDKVPNNGTSMAPYMLGVSLYVGAMIVNLMFDAYTPRKRPTNGISWWASKAAIMDGFAVLAATIAFFVLTGLNHLAPINMFQTWIMLVLASVAFMSLVTWLNLLLGRAGSFIAMILLVVQLGGAAGTFPIELSNGFFEAIHSFLPMSYVVSGLRETVMIGGSAGSSMLILIGIIVVFSLFNILHYARLKARMTDMDFEEA